MLKLLYKFILFEPEFNNKRLSQSGLEKRHISSASSALAIGGVLGLIQALFLIFAAKPILTYMGVEAVSAPFVIYVLLSLYLS